MEKQKWTKKQEKIKLRLKERGEMEKERGEEQRAIREREWAAATKQRNKEVMEKKSRKRQTEQTEGREKW